MYKMRSMNGGTIMSEKTFRKLMKVRQEEQCYSGFKPPFEICAIAMIALSAITWIGFIGLKKHGGKLPWE